MKKTSRSKNFVTIPQLKLACRHVDELKKVGMTENFAIRSLELFADSYARQHSKGRNLFAPLHTKDIDLWSKAAKRVARNFPGTKSRGLLRVEHGTPRRAFARFVLELHKSKKLTVESMRKLIRFKWGLAVITVEEDLVLNKVARSKAFSSPRKRWEAAGIRF